MWLLPERRAHSLSTFARASHIEGWPFSKCGSRLSDAHILATKMKELHGLRVGRFQNVVLASAPRTFVLNTSFTYSHG
eukprot:7135405-Pyramimonas_sp.AAC.1